MKGIIKNIIEKIILLFLFWVFVTSSIQRFKCDKMNETQLFKRIKQNILLNFNNC